VWPRVYTQREELWKEGNELVIWGKVRVRDEEISIACDEADYYEPPVEEESAVGEVALASTSTMGVEKPAQKTVVKAAQRIPETPVNHASPLPVSNVERRRLIIDLHQTKDEQGDIDKLSRIVTILKEYKGKDEVLLNVINGGAPIPLKMPNLQAGYSPELKKRLVEITGEEGLKIEKIR